MSTHNDHLTRFGHWDEDNAAIVIPDDHSNRTLAAETRSLVVLEPGRGSKGYGQREIHDPGAVSFGPRSGGAPRQDRDRELPDRQ